MQASKPSTADLIALTRDLITPLMAIERTMVMPFNQARHENVAEHSYMLATLGCALARELDASLDIGKIAHFALVHDLVEIHAGDTTVWASSAALQNKKIKEARAIQQIKEDTTATPWITEMIEAYERQDSPESLFVYALDKILPHILIIAGDHHPVHPTWKAYLATEEVALQKIGSYPKLLPYFKELGQIFRQSPHFFADSVESESTASSHQSSAG